MIDAVYFSFTLFFNCNSKDLSRMKLGKTTFSIKDLLFTNYDQTTITDLAVTVLCD